MTAAHSTPAGDPALATRSMTPGVVVLLLSLLLGLQPVTTDLYLPALPALTEGFGARMAQAQLTLTGLLLAFGLSQLVWGPLSDRLGRRPVLLVGMGAYAGASIGSVFAGSMESLIVWRCIQGVAMGAGVMTARAIVRDLYHPVEGARVMSKALTGLGVLACLSAPAGGFLADHLGWRAALAAVAAFGGVALVVVAWRYRETHPDPDLRALDPARLVRSWRDILRHPTFIAWSALSTASYGGLFTYLAASSFVFIRVLGLSKTQYGLLMLSASVAYIGGTFLCRELLVRFGVRRTVAIAGGLSLAGGGLTGALSLLGQGQAWYGPWAVAGPFYLFMVAHGIHQPCGQSGAVGPFPRAAGTASALNGCLMMLAAFAMGGWLGRHMDDTVFPLTLGLWFWGTVIALCAWTLVQRHGETPKP